MLECSHCGNQVVPQQRISVGWVIFWAIVFLPALFVYLLTLQRKFCPQCQSNVFTGAGGATPVVSRPLASSTSSNNPFKNPVILAVVVAFCLFLVCTIAIVATSDEDDSPSTPMSPSTLTLWEYWDSAACRDLVGRLSDAERAGYSGEEIALALIRSDSAVSRYGVEQVINHCAALLGLQ